MFKMLHKYNMRLFLKKCVFGVKTGKFHGFMLTEQGIEANPARCQAIIDMKSPVNVKEVQALNGKVVILTRFISRSTDNQTPFCNLLKNNRTFE